MILRINFTCNIWNFFFENFINMTHANLLRSLQITLVTEIGDIVTITSKQVTSSCGTVLRRDFLKKIQGREFSKFWELQIFFSKIPKFSKKKFQKSRQKILGKWQEKLFLGICLSIAFTAYRKWMMTLCWRHDAIMITRWWRHFISLFVSLSSLFLSEF